MRAPGFLLLAFAAGLESAAVIFLLGALLEPDAGAELAGPAFWLALVALACFLGAIGFRNRT